MSLSVPTSHDPALEAAKVQAKKVRDMERRVGIPSSRAKNQMQRQKAEDLNETKQGMQPELMKYLIENLQAGQYHEYLSPESKIDIILNLIKDHPFTTSCGDLELECTKVVQEFTDKILAVEFATSDVSRIVLRNQATEHAENVRTLVLPSFAH